MTLTEALEHWVHDAERMSGARATLVVVTEEVLAGLVDEQASTSPLVAGLPVELSAASCAGAVEFSEMVEIPGPDRVSIYVGPSSGYPLGLDPSMPVVFVPVPPAGAAGGGRVGDVQPPPVVRREPRGGPGRLGSLTVVPIKPPGPDLAPSS